ncbi:MAG: hypothetical protein KJP02_10845, partial [Octadecabacter sp.]|nr:hypothetical protein [Octadecabacter sp.]
MTIRAVSGLIASAGLALLASTPAIAQAAFPCDWRARADNIVEPWAENSATFANGAVRIALMDTVEPAAAAFYLLIIHPPFDELGLPICTLVGLDNGLGYGAIYFNELDASYDPARGLIFDVPAMVYLPEQSFQNAARLQITVNQATGDVIVGQELG